MVPTVCLLQYDDRFGSEEGERSLGSQRNLADRTRAMCDVDPFCTYTRRDASDDPVSAEAQRPVYWRKVEHMRSLADSGDTDCDYILWMDADATPTVPPSELARAAAAAAVPGADFIASGDNEAMQWYSPFNAGVFLVRNTEGGRRIMNRWADHWHEVKEKWVRDDDKQWHTTGQWGGTAYEQGAFARHFVSEPNVAMIDWCAFQRNGAPGETTSCDPYSQLAVHFAVETKARIPEFLRTHH